MIPDSTQFSEISGIFNIYNYSVHFQHSLCLPQGTAVTILVFDYIIINKNRQHCI
jgi:hypothetical protein